MSCREEQVCGALVRENVPTAAGKFLTNVHQPSREMRVNGRRGLSAGDREENPSRSVARLSSMVANTP
jgi:hypothetical protein